MKNPFSLLVQQVYTQLGAISKNIKISAAALLPSYKKHLAEEEELIMMAEQHKMRSQLAAQFMPFFRLIARILTFRDKKYRILTFRDKKYRILTFCDKTELYLTVLQQNNVEACLRCEASLSFVPSLPNAQLQLMPACDIGSIQMEKCVVDQIQ